MKVIVVGGVAAGMSAASKIKRLRKDAQVTVYEKGSYLAYGACGLAYYVAGYNNDHTKMIIRTKEQFEAAGINTHIRHEVFEVDPASKTVKVKNLDTGAVFADSYDKLMIGVGANAILPPIDGINRKGVYTLKTMEDGLMLKEAANSYGVMDAVVIGGGYIGVEAAEAMRALNKQVTLIESAGSILTQFEPEITALAREELLSNGVQLRVGETIEAITGNSAGEVVTNQGRYTADIIVAAAGIRPATRFLESTGIAMEANGAIIVDRFTRTSLPDIYAAGDCTSVYNRVTGGNSYIPLGTYANKCGRLAGENICGVAAEFTGALASAALKVFGLQLGRTGLTFAEAKVLGINAAEVTVKTSNHPPYYPGVEDMTIKLVYSKPDYRILGAQTAGREGAALRIDIFATAIQAGMTTKELGMTDLIYSPPYSNVWDAVHIACNAAK